MMPIDAVDTALPSLTDPTDLWHALLGKGVGIAQELMLLLCRQRCPAARPACITTSHLMRVSRAVERPCHRS